ncbi:MAG TPA: serine/threonine protein kinase, partial [Polyangiaceae bacterium]|nr:serine/threonine protein kinase [Polyangiaceae bacterium]
MGVTLDIEERSRARVGSVVSGKWRLDALLGVGGMAAVYAATHRNKKRAAVKMLHRELSVEETLRRRFLREGYVANSVGHRGAVRVDDDDVDEDGSVYLVMELLEGETIEARCERLGGRLPNEEVLWI